MMFDGPRKTAMPVQHRWLYLDINPKGSATLTVSLGLPLGNSFYFIIITVIVRDAFGTC